MQLNGDVQQQKVDVSSQGGDGRFCAPMVDK